MSHKIKSFLKCTSVLFKVQRQYSITLNSAISEAEKIVHYPVSVLNQPWFINDEDINNLLHMNKSIASDHPLLKTAKSMLCDDEKTIKAWGVIVLLLSKAAGYSKKITEEEKDKTCGVLYSQKVLADAIEMIRVSFVLHKNLLILKSLKKISNNNITILSADYLLTKCAIKIAALKNQELIELVFSAVRDQSESEILGPRDFRNNPLPAKPKIFGDKPLAFKLVKFDDARSEWTLRNILSIGSLLGKVCQSTLKLAGHPIAVQKQGYLFGEHLALAWQACLDRESLQRESEKLFSLVSAPVLFQLEDDPNLYSEIEKGKDDIRNVNYNIIRKTVLSGCGLEKTLQLQKKHTEAAINVLKLFPKTKARKALNNIIDTI